MDNIGSIKVDGTEESLILVRNKILSILTYSGYSKVNLERCGLKFAQLFMLIDKYYQPQDFTISMTENAIRIKSVFEIDDIDMKSLAISRVDLAIQDQLLQINIPIFEKISPGKINLLKQELAIKTVNELMLELKEKNKALKKHQESLEKEIELQTIDLQKSEELSRTIVDGAPVGVILLDKHSNIIKWNRMAEDIYGYLANEALGNNIKSLIKLVGHNTLDNIIGSTFSLQCKKDIEGRFFEVETENKFQCKVPAEIGMTIFEIGDICQATLFIKDITQRKLAETKLAKIRDELEQVNKHTQDSISYASLIQNSIVPTKDDFNHIFSDSFTLWKPKDIVGGDIYIFDLLENKNECVSMLIDCTGHGVPGAFVTMLVKAIERNIINNIASVQGRLSVSSILTDFNKELKKILKQEGEGQSLANVGFDGGVIYYNKSDRLIKYSGANTPLYYIQDGDLTVIKADRHSIGYKSSDPNFKFQEYAINVKDGMVLYISSDGYFDQNGGASMFPFGKSKFKKIILANYHKPMSEQKSIFMEELSAYKNKEEQTDDITLIALKV